MELSTIAWVLVAAWGFGIGGAIYMAIPDDFHLEPRHRVYAVIFMLAVFTYAAALSAISGVASSAETWKYAGLFLGPTLVAIGWIVTNEVNIRNTRKQHTINLILQYFTNAKRIKDKEAINAAMPPGTTIDAVVKNLTEADNPLLKIVIRELNFFDFLASAILRHEIEEKLMRRVFRNIVRRHCIQCWPYIVHAIRANSETWADFVALYARWKLQSDPVLRMEPA